VVSLGFARESIQASTRAGDVDLLRRARYIGPIGIVMYCNVLLHDVHIARYNITLVTH